MLILLDLLAIFGSAIILWIACALLHTWLRDEILFRRLRTRKRVLDWKEVEDHLNAGAGTLIIEQTNKIGVHFWWTPDDLTSTAHPPILNWDGLGSGYITGKTSEPFVLWCFEKYLSQKYGQAFLTRLKGLQLPPGPVESDFIRNLYPRARIVQTLMLRGS